MNIKENIKKIIEKLKKFNLFKESNAMPISLGEIATKLAAQTGENTGKIFKVLSAGQGESVIQGLKEKGRTNEATIGEHLKGEKTKSEPKSKKRVRDEEIEK